MRLHPCRYLCAPLLAVALFAGLARGEQPLTDFPVAAQDAFKKGMQLQEAKRFQDALEQFAAAEQLGLRDHPLLKLHQSQCQAKLKDFRQAITGYTTIIDGSTTKNFCRH